MMGTKLRVFGPLVNASLDDLVPKDHFSRHVERSLDLTFVRDLVQSCYAPIGRPSVDPVVFFKLQLAMFFEGLRSERQLMEVATDRLSLRWYLGYDLHEKLPDHSSLSKIRDRYGVTVFRRFFDRIAEQCQQAGLVWGKALYFDSTQVEANADRDKKTVVACLLTPGADGKPTKQIRTFGIMTADLVTLAEWLEAAGCTHGALEQLSNPLTVAPIAFAARDGLHMAGIDQQQVTALVQQFQIGFQWDRPPARFPRGTFSVGLPPNRT